MEQFLIIKDYLVVCNRKGGIEFPKFYNNYGKQNIFQY